MLKYDFNFEGWNIMDESKDYLIFENGFLYSIERDIENNCNFCYVGLFSLI